ncbi:M23 family metallopeptidase [Amnibacterium kyonggiense]|uniref:Peptidase M23-like protein n=1 Tax=Amnibacterium kyonggiense TaxID=595671 RepID=A0A4R7FRZ2_9MICO|nr:M23 family metallopeptidase [Amnibacterium kyonggiense]TDS80590.1 peptidase M23-like protein [Amnibacterium kyonggiense]
MPDLRTVLATASGRVRLPAQAGGALAIVAGVVLVLLDVDAVGSALTGAGVVLLVVALVGTFLGPAVHAEPLLLAPPVEGRWEALNSPTSKVPSHGTHAYGQAYAIDLIAAPEGVPRPRFGEAGGSFLPPDRFPAFGRPVLAPADAVVVRAVDRMRDHRSRSSWAAYGLFFLEAIPREALGPTGVLGNHVVLRLADGTHFVLAHLQAGSVAVRRGERVVVGQPLARCGNTGNTTEPHLHCQRQDTASVFTATGLPWTVRGGLPANGAVLATQAEAGASTEP